MDAKLRLAVQARAEHCCEYCRVLREFSELPFHVEHIIPRQHGGTDAEDNLALACPSCNLRKGPNLTGRDPATGEIVRLFHPRNDQWDHHFTQQAGSIVGITPIGRTTASLLDVNEPGRVRIREIMARVSR
jgi:hypothetical protein